MLTFNQNVPNISDQSGTSFAPYGLFLRILQSPFPVANSQWLPRVSAEQILKHNCRGKEMEHSEDAERTK